jgi:phosphatidate phosphatase APP1
VDAVERVVDRDPYGIVAYRGYAASDRALVLARVLQEQGIEPADPAHGRWRNLVHALRRLESDPLPFARVRATVAETVTELTADDEGFLHDWVPLPAPPRGAGWHPVELELVDQRRGARGRARAQVLAPAPAARFGVVSDMDDTVLQSDVIDFVRAARLVLLENARTRLPFHGVAAFYRALERGAGGADANPVFYVSNSPWNIYDVIEDFLAAQGIPAGPLLLRDWDLGLRLRRRPGHKATAIPEILATYPDLPFVLIGDSGQEDPEIYRAVLGDHPGRILAAYIRNVTRHPERDASIRRLADEVRAAGSILVLADDTLAIAEHAAEHGWIATSALAEIGEEKRADEGTTSAKMPAPGVEPPASVPTVVVEDDLPL